MYALRTASVVLAAVKCGVNEVNTTMLPAPTGTATAALAIPQHSKPIGGRRCRERAVAVRAGHDHDATVLERRIGDRDPAGEVRLRLDERVAVVLVPEHGLAECGCL